MTIDAYRTVLTVCVIGRNQLSTLRACAQSLAALRYWPAPVETIYVDSASTDGSAEQARELFDVVIALAPSPHLNAAAGRWAGARAARGDWMLFLDGDMELCAEFTDVLKEYVGGHGRGDGVAGVTINVFPDGASRPISFPGNAAERPCRMFGGAVLISRAVLAKAGGWNPRLYSNEEMELYGRLRAGGATIYWTSVPLAKHYTARISPWRMLAGSFWPFGSVLGKKFYGVGQVVVAGVRAGTLSTFVKARLGAFVFLASGVAALVAIVSGHWSAGGALGAVGLWAAVRDGGHKGPVIFASWVPQILFGMWRYPVSFEPEVSSVWRRPAAGGSGLPDMGSGAQR